MAASEKTLGVLHEKVAKALTEQVEGYEDTEVVGDVEVTRLVRPSPALLGAAIAFLKNNNVTADAEENAALRDLSKALANKRKRKLPQDALDDAATQFANSYGGITVQ